MGWPESFSGAEDMCEKQEPRLVVPFALITIHYLQAALQTPLGVPAGNSQRPDRESHPIESGNTANLEQNPQLCFRTSLRPHNCHNCVLGGLHSPLNKKQLWLLQKTDIVLEACEETWQKHCLRHSSYPKFFKNRLLIQPWCFVKQDLSL